MAESTAYARRGYKGGAKQSTIPAGISNTATSFAGADLSTWAGASTNGSVMMRFDPGLATEEVAEFTTVSGNNVTGLTRGLRGTSVVAHDPNCKIELVGTDRDFDEANAHVSDSRTTAHAAAKISYAGVDNTGTIDDEAATTVEAALDDLFTNKVSKAVGTAADSLVTFSAAATPIELLVAASRIIGKKATGGLGALTAAEVKTILAIANTDVSGLGTASTKDTGYTASKIPVLTGSPGTPDGTKFLRDDGTWATAGGGVGYGTLDHTQAYMTVDQALSTGTETKLLLGAEDFDTSSQHSIVSSTGDIVIATTGVYEIDGVIGWDSSTAGTQRVGRIKKNATIIRQSTRGPAAYEENIFPPLSLSLTAGDVIALFGFHDKGSNMSVFSDASVQRATFLRVKRLS